MMSINETISKELGADRYSYIELYDVDTDVLIYHGWAWDCPYTTYIVKDYQVYNANNKVCFKMWVDCSIGELENAIDEMMQAMQEIENSIIIPYDENVEIHNTPLGEMTTEQFIEWKKSFE